MREVTAQQLLTEFSIIEKWRNQTPLNNVFVWITI